MCLATRGSAQIYSCSYETGPEVPRLVRRFGLRRILRRFVAKYSRQPKPYSRRTAEGVVEEAVKAVVVPNVTHGSYRPSRPNRSPIRCAWSIPPDSDTVPKQRYCPSLNARNTVTRSIKTPLDAQFTYRIAIHNETIAYQTII